MNRTKLFGAASAALSLVLAAAGPLVALAPEQKAVAALPPGATPPAAPTSDQIVATRSQDRIKDLTCSLVVKQDELNRDELKKIGGAFATTYTFSRMNVSYQYPNKARFEGKTSIGSGYMVYNGDRKAFKIAFLGLKHDDTHGQPGQKQSLLDLGIFARDWLTTDWEPHYLGKENGLDKYKLSQRFTNNRSHEIAWVDPKTYLIVRKLSYNGDNKFLKELRYKNPVQVKPGIWIPTRVELWNQFGKLAAVQTVENVHVNEGVDPKLFDAS